MSPRKNPSDLSYNAVLVLQAIEQGNGYGFEIMRVTGLPSGTVYPLLRRLESVDQVRSRWENQDKAHSDRRPARRYYEATTAGKSALIEAREKLLMQQAAVFGDLLKDSRRS